MVVDAIAIKITNGIFLQVNVFVVQLKDALKDRKIQINKKVIKNVEKINFIIKTSFYVLIAQKFLIQKVPLMVVDVIAIKITNGIFLQANVFVVQPKDALKDRKTQICIKVIKNVERINFIIKTSFYVLIAQQFLIQKVPLMVVNVIVIKIINGIFLQVNALVVHPKENVLDLLENIINDNKRERIFDISIYE
jgi:hypothetical protein